MERSTKERVLLAYSGGLDTSCIVAWLIEQGYDVLCYLANVGQQENFDVAVKKAKDCGASKVFVEDLRLQFLEEAIYTAIQANTVYDGVYLLGTCLARPVIAKRQVEIAARENCQYVAHGCTGKGNDQVRFELAYYALNPNIKVIAPWRLPEFYERFHGRRDLLEFAANNKIPVSQTVDEPWSTDENLFHISYEAGILEDPSVTPPANMWKLTRNPEEAPDTPTRIIIEFLKGKPVKVCNATEGKIVTGSLQLFLYLNKLAGEHGIGRVDMVENRAIGIKCRGCYETPAGTVLRAAHLDLEGLTMDRQVRQLRDQWVTPQFSNILYNGLYYSPEAEFLMAAIKKSQENVSGQVKLKLYKGTVTVEGRLSEANSLYDMEQSSMDVQGGIIPEDAAGFINTQAIRLKKWSEIKKYT